MKGFAVALLVLAAAMALVAATPRKAATIVDPVCEDVSRTLRSP